MENRIVIIGAGSVGATFAYALIQSGQAREVVLVDMDRERAVGEVMDLQQGVAFTHPVQVRVGDYGDCRDAGVVVITAGAKQKPGETRLQLSGRNAKILESIIPQVVKDGFEGILMMVSNPVDVLTQLAWEISGLPRERVIGSGTVLDTARLRFLLSEHCRVDARNIHAMIIGEHGDSEVAVWSAATIGGIPIKKYCEACHICPSDAQHYEQFLVQVRRAAYDIITRKGATYYAIGLALVQICNAILRDEHRVLPISSVHEDFHGVTNIALSLPTIVSRKGVERVLPIELAPDELEALKHSAATIKNSLESIHQLG